MENSLSLLIWIAFVPLFFAIENKKPIQAFFIFYIAGTAFFLANIWWLIHVSLPGMIVIVLYLAFYFGIFGLMIKPRIHGPGFRKIFIIPAIWVSLEWLRSIGPFGFGWSLLAHSQTYNLPVIQISDITGVYGVSFLVMMINTAIYSAIKSFQKKNNFMPPIVIALLALFITLGYGYYRLNNVFTGEKLKVTVIQGNIPQGRKWDYNYREEILSKYENLTKEAVKVGTDLVVWPETSIPGFISSEKNLFERVKNLAKEIRTPILAGAPREDEVFVNRYYNSAALFLEDGRVAGYYDKIHLVPFGEYIPFKKALSFVEAFAPIPIGDFTSGRAYTVFNFFVERAAEGKDSRWHLVKKAKFSVLICFEDIFPEISRNFVRNGADFLINITNDAWFKYSAAPYQHAQSSVFRAVENRVNVVRAANTGLSCFIDQKGKIYDEVKTDRERIFIDGFKTSELTLTKTRTLYNIMGDVFAYMCLLAAVLTLVLL